MLHVALIVFRFDHPPKPIKDSVATQVFVLAVTILPTAIVRVYLVLVLLVTQNLALKRNFHITQSLTSLHDKSNSWLGLGSAIGALFHRKRPARDTFGVFCILSYLACMLVLGITTPALVNLTEIVKSNDTLSGNLTKFLRQIGNNDVVDAFPVISILPLLDNEFVTTIGTDGNLIYDIPTSFFVKGAGDVNVSAVIFNVVCQALPGAAQSGSVILQNDTNSATYPFHLDDALADVQLTPTIRALNVVPARLIGAGQGSIPPATLIIGSTLPIIDDNEEALSTVSISPSISPLNCGDENCVQQPSIQLIACNVNSANVTAPITPELEIDWGVFFGDDDPSQTLWSNWSIPPLPTDPVLFSVGNFGGLSPPSEHVQSFRVGNDNTIRNYNLSLLEDNLMNALGFYQTVPPQNLLLEEVNEFLEQALAVVLWRASEQLAFTAASNATFQDQIEFVTWYQVQPCVGLAISLVMLIIAMILTPQTVRGPSELQSLSGTGILQLTWLLGNNTSIPERMESDVPNPDMGALRTEGLKIEVKMSECVKNRLTNRKSVRSTGSLAGLPTLASTYGTETPGLEEGRPLGS
ncbi:hypothetical protein PHLCEN_2v1782 [Hermanssonia centrifuga]|uniref:Uncharacterized protein n=1 Tax=Hermanssonia centrifuga TaxID=98765 RepID=A0A2R6RVZ5_9APHY|nr:hypothetical protein PHLCEN_2v1782 [Hermanssonia centrifuga]